MDRDELARCVRGLNSFSGFLRLLNDLKAEADEDNGVGADSLDVEAISLQGLFGGDAKEYWSAKELKRFASPWLSYRYRSFEIPKKSGGSRVISAPARTKYKVMLWYVNDILKALYTPNKYAMGFVEGRSVATNASIHTRQNYVYNIDLKDFFPSITEGLIRKRLEVKPYSLSPRIARLIAGLATMRVVESDLQDGSEIIRYVLPQGSPISPILTNMICERLDRRLGGLARRFGVRYSRYADDITFSSMHNVYQKNSEFITEMRRIIEDLGFEINEKKVRLQKWKCRQEVTGIIISDKINVPQSYVRNIRNLLYIWDRYGYADALARFLPQYKQDKGHVKKGTPELTNVLSGKLLYLKMVKGARDSVYLRLQQTFEELMWRDFDSRPQAKTTETEESAGALSYILDDLSLSLEELLSL